MSPVLSVFLADLKVFLFFDSDATSKAWQVRLLASLLGLIHSQAALSLPASCEWCFLKSGVPFFAVHVALSTVSKVVFNFHPVPWCVARGV